MRTHKARRLLPPQLVKSRTLLINFLRLILVLFVIVAGITLFMYRNARDILQKELLTSNENTAQSMARMLDDLFSDMRYVTATIAANDMVQFYFSDTSPTNVFGSYYERIHEQLRSYINGLSYIHSIYIYAPEKGRYITSQTGEVIEKSITSLQDPEGSTDNEGKRDNGWLEAYAGMTGDIAVIPRAVANRYPFAITILCRVRLNESEGVIVMNLNLRRLPNMLDTGADSSSHFFIIDNNAQLLYRKNQDALFENIGDYPELTTFAPNVQAHSSLAPNAPEPYVYTQVASRDYDWNYVTVTYLREYTHSLSNQRAILMVFLVVVLVCVCAVALYFSQSFYRPIRRIIDLLADPETIGDDGYENEADVREIVEQIVSHIQTNNRLSNELKNQLRVLNETRLWAFQSQINPHFLSNTLNLIHLSIVDSLGHKHVASRMTVHLGKMLRFALEPDNLVTLENELAYTEHFLAIINARFDDRIAFEINIAKKTESARVPKLILQPLIENAVSHGSPKDPFLKAVGSRKLLIRITGVRAPVMFKKAEIDAVVLTVEDSGVGIAPSHLTQIRERLATGFEPEGEHIGLTNVATRLRLLFGEEHIVEVENGDMGGARIRLVFPYRE